MKKVLVGALLFACALTTVAQESGDYVFTPVKELKVTPVKNQNRTGRIHFGKTGFAGWNRRGWGKLWFRDFGRNEYSDQFGEIKSAIFGFDF